jgi:hypothetical protein
MQDLTAVDFLCLLEAGKKDWDRAIAWLEEKTERRLVLVDALLPKIEHPQIKWRSIESPLQIEPLAKQTAWEAVFLKMAIAGGQKESSQAFRKELEKAHLAANLLLSDAADCGASVAKHCFLRKQRPVRQGMKLAGAFPNIPAIIVGAGPSLEKNGHLLEAFRDQALIFAGGSALNALPAEPHFIASIDREAPYRDFKRHPFSETPLCFQSRMNPDNFSLVHGEAILFPDSHFRFLNEGDGFEGGWTVGTFLVSLATLMRCDPIILVGMDYCYQAGRKYAGGEGACPPNLVEATAKDGSKVWTQSDWLMARKWLEEWAVKYPQLRFFDATEGGLGFASPIRSVRLNEIEFEKKGDLREMVHQAIAGLPLAPPMDWESWKASLEKCGNIASDALLGGAEDFEGEQAYEELLLPLWGMWSYVFMRALESDPHPDKLKLNRLLFFQQVIQEHLRAIE